MDEIKLLQKGDVAVLIIPNEEYSKKLSEISRYCSNTYNLICYVTLNNSVDYMLKIFERSKVDYNKFFFIDAVTLSVNPYAPKHANCKYIKSASSLTDLSIAINADVRSHKPDCLIFDSLSTLLVYTKGDTSARFVHSIIEKLRVTECTSLFTALEGDTDKQLLKETEMFVNKVVHLK